MEGKIKYGPAILLIVLVALFTSTHFLRWQSAAIKSEFIKSNPVSNAQGLGFSSRGVRLSDYQAITLPLPNRADNKGIDINLTLDILSAKGLFFQLKGHGQSADFLFEQLEQDYKFSKGLHKVQLRLHPSNLEFVIDDQILQRIKIEDSSHDHLTIVTLESDFYLRSLSANESQSEQLSFVPKCATPIYRFAIILVLTLCWFVLTIFIQNHEKLSPVNAAMRVLYYFTPLWAGLAFPLHISLVPWFTFLTAISLAGFLGHVFADKLLSFAKWSLYAFMFLALFQWAGCLDVSKESLLPLITAIGTCIAFVLVAFGLKERQSGFFNFAVVPLFVMSMATFGHLPWFSQNRCGVTWALGFSAMLMLFFIAFARSDKLRAYTIIILFTAFITLAHGEMTARLATTSDSENEIDTKVSLHAHEFMTFLQEDIPDPRKHSLAEFAKSFRSGVTSIKKTPGTYRIMVLGGSNTYGNGIPSSRETFSGILAQCLNEKEGVEIEVINGGIRGYNLFMLTKVFQDFGRHFAPDMLILYVNWIDSRKIPGPFTFHELQQMNTGTIDSLLARWTEHDKYQKQQKQTGSATLSLQSFLRNFVLYKNLVAKVSHLKKQELRPLSKSFGVQKDINPVAEYKINLHTLVALCDKQNIELVLVSEFDAWNESDPGSKRHRLEDAMEIAAKKSGVHFFNLHKQLHKRKDKFELFFTKPPLIYHLNEKGHQVVGSSLCQYLLMQNLLP